MIISPDYPEEKALEQLLERLHLPEEDYWDLLGTEWVRPDHEASNVFFRVYKGEFDVAIVFSEGDRIDVCTVVGEWQGPANLDYQPGKPVANLPTGEEWFDELQESVENAAIARRSTFRVCNDCKEYLPPEHMHEDNLCQACATVHHGVIY